MANRQKFPIAGLLVFLFSFPLFNISLPYVQVKNIKKKDSNAGQIAIIETCRLCGGFTLTFRSEKTDEIASEISRLFRVYIENPVLGLEVNVQEVPSLVETTQTNRVFDDIKIVEPLYAGQSHASAAYFVSETSTGDNVIFSPELGLAIEATPNNISIEQLWRII